MRRMLGLITGLFCLISCSGGGDTVVVRFDRTGDVAPETEVYYNARQIGQVLYVEKKDSVTLLTLQFNGQPRPAHLRFYIQQSPFLRDQVFADSVGNEKPKQDTLVGSFLKSSQE